MANNLYGAEKRASPRNQVEARDSQLSREGEGRRAFLRHVKNLALLYVPAAGGYLAIVDHYKNEARNDSQRLQELLARLFGNGDTHSTALLPATHHFMHWLSPDNELGCYRAEFNNCESYSGRFNLTGHPRRVHGKPNLRPDDALVIFGSQASNLHARYLFGNPVVDRPLFDIRANHTQPKGLVSGWRAKLRWNFCSPAKSADLELMLDGAKWETKDHFIVDNVDRRSGGIVKPHSVEEEDYLLVTVLPRFATGSQRVVWFMGIHRPAQISVDLLLRQPPVAQLEKLSAAVKGSCQYYQALFHVAVQRIKSVAQISKAGPGGPNDLRPTALTFLEAWPLDREVTFA